MPPFYNEENARKMVDKACGPSDPFLEHEHLKSPDDPLVVQLRNELQSACQDYPTLIVVAAVVDLMLLRIQYSNVRDQDTRKVIKWAGKSVETLRNVGYSKLDLIVHALAFLAAQCYPVTIKPDEDRSS